MKNAELNNVNHVETVTISREEYEAQQTRIEKLEQQITLLTEALRLAQHKRFGASSEKSDEAVMEQLSFLFNEAEAFSAPEEDNVIVVPEHKRHKKHEYTLDSIPEDVPTEIIEHTLEGEELVCPQCGDTMTEIGVEVVRKLKMKPVEIIVEEHRYHSYACQRCNKENTETPVVKAPLEKSIISGSFATAEAISHIMVQKFVMGSPLYRQEKELNRMGIKLSRQTMSNWVLKASADYLKPVYEQLHKELLTHEVLHADETTLKVIHEPGKSPNGKCYMWLYRTSGDAEKPIALFEYQAGRGAKHPKEFLSGFKGYLHTDGYESYHSLPEEIIEVGCWSHARRKFDEALKSLPKGKAKNSSAAQGLAYCDLLFKLEGGWADLTPEERYQERLRQAKPVLDAFWAWANVRTAAPKSALGKSLTYLKNQWQYLTNYLKDGRLELSNNRAERSIKPFVIDRKNFLFANTSRGAEGSAVVFSMIQTAIENNLDPYRYLVWLMKTASHANMENPEVIQKLLPWNAPNQCRVK